MEIPVLSRFIKGLRLFFESKRLKWFFIIFIMSALFVFLLRGLGSILPFLAIGFIAIIGGIFPTFFMLAALLSLIGLQRFVASDESYSKSLGFFIPWIVISGLLYFILWFTGLVTPIFIGIAFMGWIGFQACISSRTALTYAGSVEVKRKSRLVTFLVGAMHIASYVIIIGSFIVLFLWYITNTVVFDLALIAAAVIGTVLAAGFNFLNGFLMIRERKRVTVINLSILGLFIALYFAYFLYNVLKPASITFDLFAILIEVGMSIFFILYTMSAVGLTLASRAHLDTRWKISSELGATITFFLASGYLVVQALFETVAGGTIGERIPDVIKIFVFPFVALVMELLFIRRMRKRLETQEITPSIPEEVVAEPEEEAEIPKYGVDEVEAITDEGPESSEDISEELGEEEIEEQSQLWDEEQ